MKQAVEVKQIKKNPIHTSNSFNLCTLGVNVKLSTSTANGGCQSYKQKFKLYLKGDHAGYFPIKPLFHNMLPPGLGHHHAVWEWWYTENSIKNNLYGIYLNSAVHLKFTLCCNIFGPHVSTELGNWQWKCIILEKYCTTAATSKMLNMIKTWQI